MKAIKGGQPGFIDEKTGRFVVEDELSRRESTRGSIASSTSQEKQAPDEMNINRADTH
jgi:hypothetical protein